MLHKVKWRQPLRVKTLQCRSSPSSDQLKPACKWTESCQHTTHHARIASGSNSSQKISSRTSSSCCRWGVHLADRLESQPLQLRLPCGQETILKWKSWQRARQSTWRMCSKMLFNHSLMANIITVTMEIKRDLIRSISTSRRSKRRLPSWRKSQIKAHMTLVSQQKIWRIG